MNAPAPGGAAPSQNATSCLNCGTTGEGRFCASCGQRKGEVRVSLRRLIGDVLEDQLSIDATLPRTLRALLLQPGRLTAEYMRGRIASYVAPFRLYLVTSLLFFLTLSISAREPTLDVTVTPGDEPQSVSGDTSARAGSGSAGARSGAPVPGGARNDSSSWADDIRVRTGNALIDSLLVSRLRRLGRMPAQEAARSLTAGMLQRAPTMMFLLLPVFAFMLKLLHLRAGRYYVEHFIFALHYHAFAFIIFTAMIVLDAVPGPGAVLGLWLFLYLPLAQKRVYAHGWVVTILKWMVLVGSYGLLLVLALLATLLVTALLL